MDLFVDFIQTNLIYHLDVFSIVNLRRTAKYFKNYKILKLHNYVRKLNNVTEILDFKKSGDYYNIAFTFEDNFISDTVFCKINEIIRYNPIYSINIINNPITENSIDVVLKISFKNNLSRILSINKKHIDSLRYIALNFIYFWKFSKERENIIIKSKMSNNFDTFLINMEFCKIKDIISIFRFLNYENYPNIKNIILDNICISRKDLDIYINNYTIANHFSINAFDFYISNSIETDHRELNFCKDFVYDSDLKLIKTEIINSSTNYKLNIYHYDRELSYNNLGLNNLDIFLNDYIEWY